MSLGMFSLAIALYFWSQKQPKHTALCFIASLFGILASLLSTARGGWIGVPVILCLIIWTFRKQISKKLIGGASLILIGLISVAVMFPQTKIMHRVNQAENDIVQYFEKNNPNTSIGLRFDMWKSAVLMAQEKPILGWGQDGSNAQRKLQGEQGIVHKAVAQFTHAHNQYLDDLSKRGILGLLALLGILLVPLAYFGKALSSENLAIKLTALLGCIHIVSVIFYCTSQGFFTHNSGTIFYFLVTVTFYGTLKSLPKGEVL